MLSVISLFKYDTILFLNSLHLQFTSWPFITQKFQMENRVDRLTNLFFKIVCRNNDIFFFNNACQNLKFVLQFVLGHYTLISEICYVGKVFVAGKGKNRWDTLSCLLFKCDILSRIYLYINLLWMFVCLSLYVDTLIPNTWYNICVAGKTGISCNVVICLSFCSKLTRCYSSSSLSTHLVGGKVVYLL